MKRGRGRSVRQVCPRRCGRVAATGDRHEQRAWAHELSDRIASPRRRLSSQYCRQLCWLCIQACTGQGEARVARRARVGRLGSYHRLVYASAAAAHAGGCFSGAARSRHAKYASRALTHCSRCCRLAAGAGSICRQCAVRSAVLQCKRLECLIGFKSAPGEAGYFCLR